MQLAGGACWRGEGGARTRNGNDTGGFYVDPVQFTVSPHQEFTGFSFRCQIITDFVKRIAHKLG